MLIDWNSLPEMAGMRAGSTRRSICGEKMSALRLEIAGDAVFDGKTHWHDNEQMLILVSGTAKLTIDGKVIDAAPGDLVFFPAGSRHAVIGTGPEGCVYYELFAPARPDQLPGWVGPSVLRFD
jgi:mannose-6-phosphate isomerase-like protein (cupin superfamily)